MSHPLVLLFENRPESVAAAGSVAAPPPAPGGQPGPAAESQPPGPAHEPPAHGFEVSPGFSILAVRDPPGPGGRPVAVTFGPGLSLPERRQVVEDFFEYWDRVDKRVARRQRG